MRNILLPSDLSVQSLWPVKKIMQEHSGKEQVTIRIVHMIEIPTSIGDLLFLGRNKKYALLSNTFKDAIQILKQKGQSCNVRLTFEFVYGNNSRVLNNFIDGALIEEIVVLEGYNYEFKERDSVNMIPLLKKIKKPLISIDFKFETFSDFQVLSILLNNDEKEMEHENVIAFSPSIAV